MTFASSHAFTEYLLKHDLLWGRASDLKQASSAFQSLVAGGLATEHERAIGPGPGTERVYTVSETALAAARLALHRSMPVEELVEVMRERGARWERLLVEAALRGHL
jgi:hypothetical protein